jgi:hypothetical protein
MIPPVFEAAERASLVCITAAEEGQAARRDGDLLRARQRFAQCAASTCPAVVRRDCGSWLEDVSRQVPSVVLGARDEQGHDVLDAVASVDGTVVQRRLDGSPVELNPGPHVVRVEIAGSPPVTIDVVLRAGEKNRALVAAPASQPPALPGPPAPGPSGASHPAPALALSSSPEQPPSKHHGIPAGTWVLGGVGVAALSVFGAFGYLGKTDADGLRNTCAPGCSPGAVSAVRTKLVVADVALGVAVVSLAAATWIGIQF